MIMPRKSFSLFIFLFIALLSSQGIGKFKITRINYSGGGDWYSDPSSLSNLLEYVNKHTNLDVNIMESNV